MRDPGGAASVGPIFNYMTEGAYDVPYGFQAVYGTVVIGNCSYCTVTSGSGRGGGYKTIATYADLLPVTAGAPAASLSVNGTQTIHLNADSAQTADWAQRYTIQLTPANTVD